MDLIGLCQLPPLVPLADLEHFGGGPPSESGDPARSLRWGATAPAQAGLCRPFSSCASRHHVLSGFESGSLLKFVESEFAASKRRHGETEGQGDGRCGTALGACISCSATYRNSGAAASCASVACCSWRRAGRGPGFQGGIGGDFGREAGLRPENIQEPRGFGGRRSGGR